MKKAPAHKVTDPEALQREQQALLKCARSLLGNLVGTSLSVEKDAGWFINLQIFREISYKERLEIDRVVRKFEESFRVPIAISEHNKPPRIFGSRTP